MFLSEYLLEQMGNLTFLLNLWVGINRDYWLCSALFDLLWSQETESFILDDSQVRNLSRGFTR